MLSPLYAWRCCAVLSCSQVLSDLENLYKFAKAIGRDISWDVDMVMNEVMQRVNSEFDFTEEAAVQDAVATMFSKPAPKDRHIPTPFGYLLLPSFRLYVSMSNICASGPIRLQSLSHVHVSRVWYLLESPGHGSAQHAWPG